MKNFLFTSNSLESKFNTSFIQNNKQSESLNITDNTVSKKKKSSLITENISKKIYICFINKIPLKFNNGLEIIFTDCNTLKEAIIKFTKIASRIKAQKKNIIICGKKYNSLTNNSFISSIDSAIRDHYETFCIINDINGNYISNSTIN